MSHQSNEIQKTKENTPLSGIIRKSFRIPIEDEKSVWAVINGNRYAVLDICPEGIGIAVEKDSTLALEQEFLNCELTIFNVLSKNLNGKIVHLTYDKDKGLLCGVQWIDMEEAAMDQISKIVSKMKKQFLKED